MDDVWNGESASVRGMRFRSTLLVRLEGPQADKTLEILAWMVLSGDREEIEVLIEQIHAVAGELFAAAQKWATPQKAYYAGQLRAIATLARLKLEQEQEQEVE